MKQRGMTLIELLVSLVATALISAALLSAYSTAMMWQRKWDERRANASTAPAFESRLKRLIERAYVTANANDSSSYFIAGSEDGASSDPNALTFTAVGPKLAAAALAEAEPNFEELNEEYGPQGGLMEVSLSLVPSGDAPVDEGLFIRTQRPPDGDETQGGEEVQAAGDITELRFEFYDGIEWVAEWDTRTNARRIPAAVRVSYTIDGEADERSFVVRLIHSDVTPDNPFTVEGA